MERRHWRKLAARLTTILQGLQRRPRDNRMNIFGPRLPKRRDQN